MRSSVMLRPPPSWSARFAVVLAAYGLLVGFAGSFTGLGGGFLLVPFLLFLRLRLYQAVGTSFVAVLAISLTAVSKHAAHGSIMLEVGLALGIGGVLGSQVGARLVKRVSRRRFHRIFSVILLGLAAYLAADALLKAQGEEPLSPTPAEERAPLDNGGAGEPGVTDREERAPRSDGATIEQVAPPPALEGLEQEGVSPTLGALLALGVVGLLVGVAAAFAGMGGGFLLVPILLMIGFGVVGAVATAFIAILMISASALYAHIRQKGVLWRHGLVLAAAGVAGAYLGAAVLHDVSAELFKAIFALLLAVFGTRMVYEGWRPSRRVQFVEQSTPSQSNPANEVDDLPDAPVSPEPEENDDNEDSSVPSNP